MLKFVEEQNQLKGLLFIQQYLAQLTLCAWKLSCFSHVQLCETLWTIGHQSPRHKGFSRQEYWSEMPFPSPGNLLNTASEFASPMLQVNSWPLSHLGSSTWLIQIRSDQSLSHVRHFATSWKHRSPGSSVSGNFPSKNTGVVCHFLLQGIFLTQGSKLCLLHWTWILYCWATWEVPNHIVVIFLLVWGIFILF